MAFPNDSRPFASIGRNPTSNGTSTSNALSISYGKGRRDWGPNSIWASGGLGNGLASQHATRESSREPPRQSRQDERASTGPKASRTLLADGRWHNEWHRSQDVTLSQPSCNEGQAPQQHRSTSNATLPPYSGPMSSSRPPAISLDTTSATTPAGHRYAASNAGAGLVFEQAPNVYTKHDRHQNPSTRRYHDSPRDALWASNVPSTDTRGPFPTASRTGSQPMSRKHSQTPSFSGHERSPFIVGPDYTRGPQRPNLNGSRATSVSSQLSLPPNSCMDFRMEHLPTQFGQLSMNGDSRPQTSHRSSGGTSSHPFSAGISPLTQSSMCGPEGSVGIADDTDDLSVGNKKYAGFPNSLSPLAANFAGHGFGGRYPPTPASADFRPEQSYFDGFKIPVGSKTSTDWRSASNDLCALQPSRPYTDQLDQQAYWTPQLHQYMASQIKQQYGSMFNPFGMPGAVHLNSVNGYPLIMPIPMPFPHGDQNPPVQEMLVGENIQSALLYEFKSPSAKTKRYELRDIYEHIAEFSGDQAGSRFVQTKLETANSDEKNKVFSEIKPNALQLMTDVFGNYVIQKFFEHGDQMHKKILATKMQGHVLQLSNQMYGCRVVQKALDHVLVDQQAQLIRELDGHVLACVKDQNGNHVIQKAIERCPSHTIGFIISSFQGSVQQLSVNSYGCRVIQRCIEHCDKSAKAMIMAELVDGIQGMITDQYGNYVVQHVVERDDGEGRRNVLNIVLKSLELYSKHKFASNVVEKCLEWADDSWRQDVLWRLSNHERRGPDGESILVGMIKDNYGNYVIQKLLDTISPTDYFNFLEALQPAVSQAKRTGCGKQIQSVERKMERFSRTQHNHPQSVHHGRPPLGPGGPFGTAASFQFGAPAPPFASNYGSTGSTPPLLTADQSRQSSTIQSMNGDAVEGAHAMSRKGSEMSPLEGFMR